jgi:hypothetical protein
MPRTSRPARTDAPAGRRPTNQSEARGSRHDADRRQEDASWEGHYLGDRGDDQAQTKGSKAPLLRVVDQLIRWRVKALPLVDGEQRVLGVVTGATCCGAATWARAAAYGRC